MGMWINQTNVADLIEIEWHTATGRYRWRERTLQNYRGAKKAMGYLADDRPWTQADIPPRLLPRWLKGNNLNGQS